MTDKRKIVDAREDEKGTITHVRFEGNSRFTPKDTAIPMAERGEIENHHVVHPTDGREDHLRSNPDRATGNNLDTLAED